MVILPDVLQDILIFVNTALSIAIFITCIELYFRETRKGFHWIWIALGLVGLLWTLLYISNMINFPISMRNLMSTGIIRSVITLTLGTMYAVSLQFRIPRRK